METTPGMQTLAALAPGLELVRAQLDADALIDPDMVDAWKDLDATGHMSRLLGYVDGLVTMPETTVGDIREVTAAIVAAGLMVLTQLVAPPVKDVTPKPEPSRILRVVTH